MSTDNAIQGWYNYQKEHFCKAKNVGCFCRLDQVLYKIGEGLNCFDGAYPEVLSCTCMSKGGGRTDMFSPEV